MNLDRNGVLVMQKKYLSPLADTSLQHQSQKVLHHKSPIQNLLHRFGSQLTGDTDSTTLPTLNLRPQPTPKKELKPCVTNAYRHVLKLHKNKIFKEVKQKQHHNQINPISLPSQNNELNLLDPLRPITLETMKLIMKLMIKLPIENHNRSSINYRKGQDQLKPFLTKVEQPHSVYLPKL